MSTAGPDQGEGVSVHTKRSRFLDIPSRYEVRKAGAIIRTYPLTADGLRDAMSHAANLRDTLRRRRRHGLDGA